MHEAAVKGKNTFLKKEKEETYQYLLMNVAVESISEQ
jgi:hypothetical protein